METYDPQAIEAKWQRVWEDARAFYVDEPRARAREPERQVLHARDAARTPRGTCTWGTSSTTRWATSSRTSSAATASTCCARWAATRSACPPRTPRSSEGGHPREIIERNIDNIERQMRRLGWAIDWDRVIAAHDPAYYRWTQWLFLRFFEHGLAYRKEAPVNWCPQRPDGARQRAGRSTGTASAAAPRSRPGRWSSGSSASPPTPTRCCDDHALIDWPERTKTIQRNWIGRSEGAELLFRDRRARHRRAGLHDAAGHALRRDVLRARARAPAGRRSSSSARRTATRLREYVEQADGQARRGARGGRGEDRRLHRPLRGQPGDRRADPGLGRRLRADGVRHRRDHGRARRTTSATARSPSATSCRSCRSIDEETGVLVNSGQFSGLPVEEAQARDRRVARASAAAAGRRSASGCATGASRASATGAARSRSSTAASAGSSPCRTTSCRCCCRRSRTTGRRASRRWPRTRSGCNVPCPRCGGAGQARGRHDGHLRRLVVVLPALLRPAQRPRAVRSRRLVDFWVPVDQYIGGIDHATGHLLYSRFFVKVLNEHGHGRLPRAVPAAVPPGLGAPGRHEDVEVEGQRDRARPAGRHVRRRRGAALHPVRRARPTRTWTGPRRGSRASRRFLRRLWRIVHEAARGCGRSDGAGGPAGAQGARDDREGERRHRPPVRLQHADRGGDGAGQRARRATRRRRARASPPRPRSR